MLQTVELHPKKIENLNKQPIVETSMYVSEDGKWFVHETKIVDIKPFSYMEKVFKKED